MRDFTELDAGLRSRDVLAIAVPMILSQASTPLVGIVDTAVVGQLDEPVLIGAVALGSTIFAMLFWAFGFLRMGTTGLTAQAAGEGNRVEIAANLYRALFIAAVAGIFLFSFHAPAMIAALKFIGGDAQLQTATADYFGVRIISAPATLANYAFLGWLIGLNRAGVALLLQLFLNILNIALAIVFVLMLAKGVKGAAMAAVIAEYCAAGVGVFVALKFLPEGAATFSRVFSRAAFRRAVAVNGDIMIRTICLLFAFTFFAVQGARLGEMALASNSVLRNLGDLSAFALDGFAFAAEVLTGQAVGSRSLRRFRQAIYLSSVWAVCLAFIVSVAFWLSGPLLIEMMTATPAVREAAYEFLPWAALTPVAGVACFQLDGIFIGATRTADMRNMMILSLAIFLGAWAILTPAFGNHGLWASLILFFIVRAVTLGWRYKALEAATFAHAKP